MLVIANGGTFFARTLPSLVAQRFGSMNVVFGTTLVVAMVTFCWIAVTSIAGMVVWSCLWGFTAGVFSSVDPVSPLTNINSN